MQAAFAALGGSYGSRRLCVTAVSMWGYAMYEISCASMAFA